ncbi:hypothetical protein [Roseicyclus marinus]|uniref:hypothetical protein n=1 Tax=Roseicyclus marinus TaxID=2161673 RepID=UPI00240FE70C|nr:hypothetical protein [Roseicyclus marinus]
MRLPNSDDILGVAPEAVPEFIQRHAGKKTLSRMVKQLNAELLGGDAVARARAEQALNHLGLLIRD